jgi:hypothetical protein
MDRCVEDVIIVWIIVWIVVWTMSSLFVGFTFFQKKKREKTKILDSRRVAREREGEGELHSLLGCLKDDRQKFFKYFRMSFSKFENLKQLLHTDIEKKHTQWRWNIRTEERLALT